MLHQVPNSSRNPQSHSPISLIRPLLVSAASIIGFTGFCVNERYRRSRAISAVTGERGGENCLIRSGQAALAHSSQVTTEHKPDLTLKEVLKHSRPGAQRAHSAENQVFLR